MIKKLKDNNKIIILIKYIFHFISKIINDGL